MRCRLALTGCSPEPLASYLKSLALLRLVSEQKDSAARGWWERDVFYLELKFDEAELIQFFLAEYRPTPIVAPWNGGSGFYEGNDITGREAIRASKSERFRHYRDTINEILSWPMISATAGLPLGKMIDIVQQEAANATGQKQHKLLEPVTQALDRFVLVSNLLSPQDLSTLSKSKPLYPSALRKQRKTAVEQSNNCFNLLRKFVLSLSTLAALPEKMNS